ncbi:DUF2500 domain-containing protein [Paenibacillus arenilitoris]|uniref:DUF2500 domain-containing protein n=1 Tax=Paenibacillus arenilitoris TaxID=2772299 RepID=A0A927CKM6_9BACL|nr:DUF2500 domain-containing protein [Paenibacillus arenilitoris]MBD2868917.1 DUF2500 domain-containing protein [Paenibacillus arenilitoris]
MNGFGPSFGGGFDLMFTIGPIFIVIVFVLIIGGILYSVFTHFKNASAPRESSYARIVSKRMEVRSHTNHHHQHNGIGHMSNSSRTYYYITLEFDNGQRKEYLDVKNLYGLVVEGDAGYAATQGDWIVAFERM